MNSFAHQEKFISALQLTAKSDSDYWSYKLLGQRPGLHGLIRYPAMMVPRMLADVLDAAIIAMPHIKHVVDPFVGSGTAMLEALRRGLTFDGIDINPLAILICRAKLLALSPATVNSRIHKLLRQVSADRSKAINVNFPGRDKWFTPQACVELSRIRRAILEQSNQDLRRFLWVIFAETIRYISLSRESTYKLHIRPATELEKLENPIKCFQQIALQAIKKYSDEAAHTGGGNYRVTAKRRANLSCCDVRTMHTNKTTPAQLLITSPPYGDNKSTVPYGQFSYLALRWIADEDLEGQADFRESAYAIDTASLGGSSREHTRRGEAMIEISDNFKTFFERLRKQNRSDLEAKAASFTADLFDAVDAVLPRLESGGMAIWILGERRIGGLPVPLVKICQEINQFLGMKPVAQVTRSIQSKRTPHRNSQGATMATETMLVMHKR